MRRILVVVAALAFTISAPGFSSEPVLEVPVFPNLAFTAIDGSEQIDLESFRGRPVLMTFWASWCGPCRQELPELKKLSEELAETGFALITVNTDRSASTGARFLARYQIDVPTYRLDQRTLAILGVESLPTNVLLDREGRPVAIYKGYSPDLPGVLKGLVLEMDDAPAPPDERSGS